MYEEEEEKKNIKKKLLSEQMNILPEQMNELPEQMNELPNVNKRIKNYYNNSRLLLDNNIRLLGNNFTLSITIFYDYIRYYTLLDLIKKYKNNMDEEYSKKNMENITSFLDFTSNFYKEQYKDKFLQMNLPPPINFNSPLLPEFKLEIYIIFRMLRFIIIITNNYSSDDQWNGFYNMKNDDIQQLTNFFCIMFKYLIIPMTDIVEYMLKFFILIKYNNKQFPRLQFLYREYIYIENNKVLYNYILQLINNEYIIYKNIDPNTKYIISYYLNKNNIKE